jgi:predicted DNA-binding transcriptional regulator AlpA
MYQRAAPIETAREVYSLEETLAKFGYGRTQGSALVRQGKFPVKPIKIGRRYLFPKVVVDAVLQGTRDAESESLRSSGDASYR